MRSALVLIRGLALVGVVLSVLAVPLGLIALLSALSPGVGDNAMGDAISFGLGMLLLVPGVAGLILGSGLAVLAKRSLAAPAGILGSRRIVLATGLAIAGGQVLIGTVLGGMYPLGGALAAAIGLGAAFAAAFLVVAVASRHRGDQVLAGVLAIALLGLGVAMLGVQVVQNDGAARQRERAPLLAADLSVAIDAAAEVAPDGWAVAYIVAKGTNAGIPSASRDLPATLIGHPLRGLVVVDCAGHENLEVTSWEGDTPLVIGSTPCRPEPQVMAFEIPGMAGDAHPPAYVQRISVDGMGNEGLTGSMNRAMVLVALTAAPDPDPDALLATFVAAFGTDKPR